MKPNIYNFKELIKLSARNCMTCLIISFLFVSQLASAQTTVSGKVTSDDGETIPGVSILLKGTTQGTISDGNGEFKFQVPSGNDNDVLVFSSIGFVTQEVPIQGRTYLEVVLVTDLTQLEEVVVIGYGQTQNVQTVSSAINTIPTKTIEEVSVGRYRPELVLQGTSPGVTVQQNSGSPGSPLTVRVRGVSSAGGAQPLYLVDGFQVPDLNYLNTVDIESIQIFKDAASAAIYGARGANGVVWITTKKGKRNTKPTLNFEAYYGIQNLANKPDLMDKDQFIDYYNDYQRSNGLTELTDADRAALPNTDWYDVMFDDNQPIQNYSLSLANGGERYSYYVSGGIFDQRGMLGGEDDKARFNRKNVRAYFDVDVLDNVSLRIGGDLVRTERDYVFENQAGTGVAIMNYISAIPSIYPAFDTDFPDIPFHMGDLNNPVVVNGVTLPAVGAVLNPTMSLILQENQTLTNIQKFDISANWEIIDNLNLNLTYGYYHDNSFDKQFFQQFDYRPIQNLFNDTGDLIESTFETKYSQFEGYATYNFDNWKDHHLEILGGMTVWQSEFDYERRLGSDFLVNTFDDVNFALISDPTSIINEKPISTEAGLLSFYGRVDYNYKEKYLFGATIRSDASSRFGEDNRTGIFPSFSAGWVLSEEGFMNASFIDLFKIRASWGINGIDNLADYQFSQVMNPDAGPIFNNQNIPGVSRDVLPNENIKWEQVTQTDIGLDVNLFENTLGITLDYYIKKTSDMIVPVGTPLYTGLGSASANIADVKNSGVELMLAYNKRYNSGFKWNAGFNLGYNNNEVTDIGASGQPIPGGAIGFIFADPITLTSVGQPIASFYGFEVEEIDENGTLVFRDQDGEAGITEADKTFIGSPLPDFTYGVTLGLGFKGIDFNAFFYGSQGNEIYDATVRLDATTTNRPVSYANEGAPLNILNVGATTGAPDQVAVSDFYVKDGSFTRLKFLTVGYSFPEEMIQKVKLQKLRLYFTGQNLFTITGYDGLDPEIGQAQAQGVNVSNGQSVLDLGIDRGFLSSTKDCNLRYSIKLLIEIIMNFKNINLRIPAFLMFLMVGLMSCDDLLEKTPITELSADNALETEADLVALVNSSYDVLQWQVINGAQTHMYPVMWQDIRADNCLSQWASFWAFGAQLDDFQLIQPNNTNIAALWKKWYTAVSRSNTAINFVEEFEFETDGLQARLLGEAKFVRAMAYFEIVKMWGDAPLITEFISSTDDDIYLPKSTRDEIYAQIELDLEEAAASLPESYDGSNLGRATNGAALTLLAKVHLYQGEYQEVVDYTEMVMGMGYDLEPNFAMNWDLNNEYGIESIFEIGYADGFSNSPFEAANAVTNQGSSSYQMFGYIFNGAVGGFGNSVPRQDLIDLYDDTDIRKDATFIMPSSMLENGPQSCNCLVFNPDGSPVFGDPGNEGQWVGTDIYNYFWVVGTPAWESRASMRKYSLPQSVAPNLLNNGSSPLNEKYLRYADVLLMHAEASLFASGTMSGLNSINEVIQRAYGGDPSNNLASYTLDDVKLERRKELATEGYDRFTDLVRWGDAATALAFKALHPEEMSTCQFLNPRLIL